MLCHWRCRELHDNERAEIVLEGQEVQEVQETQEKRRQGALYRATRDVLVQEIEASTLGTIA